MMTNEASEATAKQPSLPWGRCRYVLSDDSRCRRRRRPRPTEKSKLPTGTLLLASPDHLTLCWTQSPLAVESSEDKVPLCFDESVRIMLESRDLQNFSSSDVQRALSILAPHLPPERFPITLDNAEGDCTDSSHGHLTVNTTPVFSSELLDSGFVSPFPELPATLLSMSLIRIRNVSETASSSPLEQACIKRQLVGCHFVFVENELTTLISIPFQGRTVRFRVASIMPTPIKSSRTAREILYIILPSTRITIVESEKHENKTGNVKNSVPDKIASSNVSPAAELLIDTIRCIRLSTLNIPRAFLLTGPPGVGKTFSVRLAMEASEAQGPTMLVSLQGSELLSTASHPSEAAKALKRHFQEATRFCQKKNHVGIVFIDECEALLSSDGVAAMFGNLLDRVSGSPELGWQRLVIVAATNRIDAVPAWLRRPGRLDREIALGPPDATTRLQIIKSLVQKSTLHSGAAPDQVDDAELNSIAEACVGYVPADLAALVRRAALLAFQEGADNVTAEFLSRAMLDVGASALRDAALSAPPKTTWDDIAGDAGGAKTALRRAIEWPRTKKHAYASLGLVPPRGILLHGPPGCAKTTLARAAAGASGIAFFSLSPADVYASSYVGEAEAVVRRAFTLARSAAPCILFFDEIDSILGCSSTGSHGMGRSAKSAEARVLSTFLNEMDGVDASQDDGVLVLGATNRPSTLDAALLRPGRFDSIVYVPPPDKDGRRDLLEMQCRGWKCDTSRDRSKEDNGAPYVDIELLASEAVTGSFTGAEILGACREAAMKALRETLESQSAPRMKQCYLEEEFGNVKPLLSNKQVLDEYTRFETQRAAP